MTIQFEMVENNSPTKSCFTCKNLKTSLKTLEWECGLIDNNHGIDEEAEQNCECEEDYAQKLAQDCSRYEFFDWDAYHKGVADSEAESIADSLVTGDGYEPYGPNPDYDPADFDRYF